jgi:hypothetical protein
MDRRDPPWSRRREVARKATRDVSDADLDAVESGMEDIASSFGGEYDGFERDF